MTSHSRKRLAPEVTVSTGPLHRLRGKFVFLLGWPMAAAWGAAPAGDLKPARKQVTLHALRKEALVPDDASCNPRVWRG
jgi:hypothetical protein